VRWRTLRRVKLCALARAEGVSDTRGPGGAPNLSTTRRARLQARAISGACDFRRARLQARAWRTKPAADGNCDGAAEAGD